MRNNDLWRLILFGILILLAISIIHALLAGIARLLGTVITIAVIVGVVWMLVNLVSRKKSF